MTDKKTAPLARRTDDGSFDKDIEQNGRGYLDALEPIRDDMLSLYWAKHKELGELNFRSRNNQIRSAAKLGDLANAIAALREAEKAISKLKYEV